MYKSPSTTLGSLFSEMNANSFEKTVKKIGAHSLEFDLDPHFPENMDTYLKYSQKCLQKVAPLLRKMNANVKCLADIYEKSEMANATLAENMSEICSELDRFNLTQFRRNQKLQNIFAVGKVHFLAEGFFSSHSFSKTTG